MIIAFISFAQFVAHVMYRKQQHNWPMTMIAHRAHIEDARRRRREEKMKHESIVRQLQNDAPIDDAAVARDP